MIEQDVKPQASHVEEKPFCKLHRMYMDWNPQDVSYECFQTPKAARPKVTAFPFDEIIYELVDSSCPKCGTKPVAAWHEAYCGGEVLHCQTCGSDLVDTEIGELVYETLSGSKEFYDLEEGIFEFGQKKKS